MLSEIFWSTSCHFVSSFGTYSGKSLLIVSAHAIWDLLFACTNHIPAVTVRPRTLILGSRGCYTRFGLWFLVRVTSSRYNMHSWCLWTSDSSVPGPLAQDELGDGGARHSTIGRSQVTRAQLFVYLPFNKRLVSHMIAACERRGRGGAAGPAGLWPSSERDGSEDSQEINGRARSSVRMLLRGLEWGSNARCLLALFLHLVVWSIYDLLSVKANRHLQTSILVNNCEVMSISTESDKLLFLSWHHRFLGDG